MCMYSNSNSREFRKYSIQKTSYLTRFLSIGLPRVAFRVCLPYLRRTVVLHYSATAYFCCRWCDQSTDSALWLHPHSVCHKLAYVFYCRRYGTFAIEKIDYFRMFKRIAILTKFQLCNFYKSMDVKAGDDNKIWH